jgi:hypothetical protein
MQGRNSINPSTVFTIRNVILTPVNFRRVTWAGADIRSYNMCFVILSDDLTIPTNQKALNTNYKDWEYNSTSTYSPQLTVDYFPATDPTPTFYPQITSQPYVKAVLDRNISGTALTPLSQISHNFAILRPKPDETSVIVNYSKQPGNVSQAILVPQDANDEIKNNVGTIFQSLNVDLSNQSQNTNP